jgi:hypothetical protein
VAASAKALQIRIIIAAAIGQCDDMIDFSSHSSATPHTDRRSRQQTMAQPLQRSPSDALYSIHAHLSVDAKKPDPCFHVGLLGAHLSPLTILL